MISIFATMLMLSSSPTCKDDVSRTYMECISHPMTNSDSTNKFKRCAETAMIMANKCKLHNRK